MTAEILIGLGGLVLSALTYFAGVHRTERRYKTDQRQTRIQRVFDKYMEFRKNSKTAGFDGLQKAGVATLESDQEIRDLADLIIKHHETDPLERQTGLLEGVDLKKLFDTATKERVNWFRTDLKKYIQDRQLK